MARSISSSSRKEVITDVVTTTQKTTSRLIPAHSNAFPSPISTGLVESARLAGTRGTKSDLNSKTRFLDPEIVVLAALIRKTHW